MMEQKASYSEDGRVNLHLPDGSIIFGLHPQHHLWWKVKEFQAVGGVIESYQEPPPPPFIVYKADIWRRATDVEAEVMDQMLNAQPIRMRRMWTDAVHLLSDDELFATINAALTAAFGKTRAAELLAPSGG